MKIESKARYFFEFIEREQLYNFLQINHLTLSDFATKCGLSFPLLCKIVNGERAITKSTVEKFKSVGFILRFDENFFN